MCRTTIAVNGTPVVMDAEPNGYQAEVFRLLAEDSRVWDWARTQ